MSHSKRRPVVQEVRDWSFLGIGLAGIIYEAAIYDGQPRWPLLVVYLTLLGLPGALGLDALKQKVAPTEETETQEPKV